MYFRQVIAQHAGIKHLRGMVQRGHLSHAVLFSGGDGQGLLPLGLAFAAYVLCENRGSTDRCGECNSCKQLDGLVHPDLHLSFPIVKVKDLKVSAPLRRQFVAAALKQPYLSLDAWEAEVGGENKKSLITADESHEIVKSLALKPFGKGYKVLVVWHAEKMNDQAANRLLKTLEEPPPRTLILLLADHSEHLLPTIVSRCQQVQLQPLDPADIAAALASSYELSGERAAEISYLSEGNYITALKSMADETDSSAYLDLFAAWMRACVKSNLYAALEICDTLATWSRDQQQHYLSYCLDFIHRSLRYTHVGGRHARFDHVSLSFAERFAPYMAAQDLQLFHDILSEGHYLVQRNVNGHLLFMKISCELMKAFRRNTATHNA